jgi:hypothetical protein
MYTFAFLYSCKICSDNAHMLFIYKAILCDFGWIKTIKLGFSVELWQLKLRCWPSLTPTQYNIMLHLELLNLYLQILGYGSYCTRNKLNINSLINKQHINRKPEFNSLNSTKIAYSFLVVILMIQFIKILCLLVCLLSVFCSVLHSKNSTPML